MRISVIGPIHESLVDRVIKDARAHSDRIVLAGRVVPKGYPLHLHREDEPHVPFDPPDDVTYVPASAEMVALQQCIFPSARIDSAIFIEN